MGRNALRYIIFLAVLSVSGIFLIQFGFLKNTFEITEQQFQESATVALREVAWQILEASGQLSKFDNVNPVEMVNNHYYLVNVNDMIDPEILRVQLREQLNRHSLNVDFEYAIYDVFSGEMVYGEYVCARTDTCFHITTPHDFVKSDKYTYYFGVNFPNLSPYINYRMRGWYLITVLLLVVLAFFGYTLVVIIRQRQLTDIQKVFINNLTHELKTPISSIALAAQVLSDRKIIDTPQRLFGYVGIINEQCSRLAKNVEKVLSLATLEKNKLQLIKEKVVLDEFVNINISRFKQSVLGANALLVYHAPEEQVSFWCDPFHFGNVLQNIFENAVKYCTQSPNIVMDVQLKKKAIKLLIADNGIGIPREYRKMIFKKFFRVPTGNIHDVKGFGLGLDYVNRIIKAHRWKIGVSDNPGGGSIFTIIIPKANE